jgi:vacuolar-type H+-ATPase subunit I/STV1
MHDPQHERDTTHLQPHNLRTNQAMPCVAGPQMKMSIIMGVTHMNLGIMHSLFNNLFFRDWLSIWAEFVPQARFMFGQPVGVHIRPYCSDVIDL